MRPLRVVATNLLPSAEEARPVQERLESWGVQVSPATHGGTGFTVTVWLQVALLPQASVACQERVITKGQGPLFVTVFSTVMVTFVPLHASNALGVSKDQGESH